MKKKLTQKEKEIILKGLENDLIIDIPPDEDLDDNGNYIGTDPQFIEDNRTSDNSI
jgi:hypothetical protein